VRKGIKKIVSLGKFYFIGSILERSLPFLFLPLYTSYLTPSDYGILSLLTVLVSWSEKLVGAPIGNGVTRHYHDPSIKDIRGEMIFSGWLFTLIQSLVLCCAFVFFKDDISTAYLGDSSYSNLVFLFAFVMMTQPLGTLMLSLLRIQSKAKEYVICNFVVFASSAILQVVLLVYFELGIEAMVWGVVYTSIVKLLMVFPYTIKSLKFKFNWKALKSVLHFGYPLVVAALVAVASQTMDRLLINHYFDLAMVGLLALALKIPLVLEFAVATPFKQTIVPVIYEMEDNKPEQLEFVRRITTYVVCGVLFFTLCLAVFAKEIVMIVASNEEFYDAWKVIPLLLFATANGGVAIMFGNGMAMAKKSFMISLTSIFVFIINVSLLFILIPSFGIIGAGIASACAFTFRNVIRGYYSNKYYGQTFEVKKVILVTILAIAMFLVTLFFINSPLIYSIPIKALVIVLFPVIIWFSHLIPEEDKVIVGKAIGDVRKNGVKSILRT